MTQESRFWTGTATGDAGPYSFEDMNEVFRYLIGNYADQSGVFHQSGAAGAAGLLVTESSPAAASVTVSLGAALVHGSFYKSTANEVLPIAANSSGNPRIDSVVLTKLWATQTVRLEVVQGTPAGSPVAPTLTKTDGFKWQFKLADVAVANGFATILNASISNQADDNVGALVQSHVLAVDSVFDNNVTYTSISTSFADVHASKNLTITIRSTRVKVTFAFTGLVTAGALIASAVKNDELGVDSLSNAFFVNSDYQECSLIGIISGLTPGSQTFRPRFRTTSGGSVTINRIMFMVEEIRD